MLTQSEKIALQTMTDRLSNLWAARNCMGDREVLPHTRQECDQLEKAIAEFKDKEVSGSPHVSQDVFYIVVPAEGIMCYMVRAADAVDAVRKFKSEDDDLHTQFDHDIQMKWAGDARELRVGILGGAAFTFTEEQIAELNQ